LAILISEFLVQPFHAGRELLTLAGKLQDEGSEEVHELLFRPNSGS
jgi:hypothetical protein